MDKFNLGHLYKDFYKAEKGQGMAVQRIVELVTQSYIPRNMSSPHLYQGMTVLTSLEAKESPPACTVYNLMEDLKAYIKGGTWGYSKETFFNFTVLKKQM